MKTITKAQFLKDVKHEIDMLKKYATEEEKYNLNFRRFSSSNVHECIYGQLTGNCSSIRAKQLMDLSCIRVLSDNPIKRNGISFEILKKYINGKYTGQDWEDGDRGLDYLSSLEGYINLDDAKNEQIIQYIKGEIDTLTL